MIQEQLTFSLTFNMSEKALKQKINQTIQKSLMDNQKENSDHDVNRLGRFEVVKLEDHEICDQIRSKNRPPRENSVLK